MLTATTPAARKAAKSADKQARYARQCQLNRLCDNLRQCGYKGTNAEVLAWFEDDVRQGVRDTAKSLAAKAEQDAAEKVARFLEMNGSPKLMRFLAGRQNYRPAKEVLALIERFKP